MRFALHVLGTEVFAVSFGGAEDTSDFVRLSDLTDVAEEAKIPFGFSRPADPDETDEP